MEDEALQCAKVCPAELIYYRIHSSYHLPLVWLTWGEKTTKPSHTVRPRSGSLSESESQPQEVWITAQRRERKI